MRADILGQPTALWTTDASCSRLPACSLIGHASTKRALAKTYHGGTLHKAQVCLRSRGKVPLDFRRRTVPLIVSASQQNGTGNPSLSDTSAVAAVKGTSAPTTQQKIQKFLLDQFVPIGLLTAILIGCFCPGPGAHAAKYNVLRIATTGIFFISGLGLKRKEAVKALSAWQAVLFGFMSILLLTPVAGFLALRLPLQPFELALGLAVFCCMPTTLSSGVSLTSQVEGNTALALLLTIGTNLLGVFTLPFMLLAVAGSAFSGVSLSPLMLLRTLVETILVPLLIGASCRAYVQGLAGWVDRNKRLLSITNGLLLCSTPWTQVSTAVLSGTTLALPALVAVVLSGVLIHVLYLMFNMTMVSVLRLGGTQPEARHIRRAVVLCASQKTLPVAVTILSKLSASLGSGVGLAVIPCVVSHLTQIIMDSMLVAYWLKKDRALQAAASPASVLEQPLVPKDGSVEYREDVGEAEGVSLQIQIAG